MPRKGSRKIEVDGFSYRWRLKIYEDNWYGPLRYVVLVERQAAKTGRLLEATFIGDESGETYVSPVDVVAAIKRGLAGPWNPDEPGSPVVLPPIHLHRKALTESPDASKAKAKACCKDLEYHLNRPECEQHGFNCPDTVIVGPPIRKHFGLPVHDGSSSYISIFHCPFCGSKLPNP